MEISKFNIEIIDTYENERVLETEQTAPNAARLIFNGSDDEFQSLMTSELHFPILVTSGVDGELLHLYTGSETRFKVLLNDVSDPGNIKTIWTGQLLPEQYNEPFDNGGIYVHFVATDGIGRLKTQYFDDDYFFTRHPIYKIITDCLRMTGLDLPVAISPAIVNANDELGFEQIELIGGAYLDETEKMNCYDILEKLITSIGCRLFQINSIWFVVGINRIHEEIFNGYDYSNGVSYLFERDVYFPQYQRTPGVSMLPQLKGVEVNFDPKYHSILPDDIVFQFPVDQEDLTQTVPVKHWKTVNIDDDRLMLASIEKPGRIIRSQYWNFTRNQDPIALDYPFYVTIEGLADLTHTDYIELSDPPFVTPGDKLGEVKFDFELHLTAFCVGTDLQQALDDGKILPGHFEFAVLLNDTVIVSNAWGYPNKDFFETKLSKNSNQYGVDARITIPGIPINNPGFLQIRIQPFEGWNGNTINTNNIWLVVTKCEIKHNYGIRSLIKKRDVDFTTEKFVELFHGADMNTFTDRNFRIPENFILDDQSFEPGFEAEIMFTGFRTETIQWVDYTSDFVLRHTFDITPGEHELISQNPDAVFMDKHTPQQRIQLLPEYYSLFFENGTWKMSSIYDTRENDIDNNFWELRRLWVIGPEKVTSQTQPIYLSDRWKRFGINEQLPYLDAIARIYHGRRFQTRFVVNGTVLKLVSPLDILMFKFMGEKKYIPTNLELDLFDGSTDITMIEAAFEPNVDDYDEGEIVNNKFLKKE